MRNNLEIETKKLQTGGLINLNTFLDAANSPERDEFSDHISESLTNWLERALIYNEKGERFNDAVIDQVRTHATLRSVMIDLISGKGGPILYPVDILDQGKLRDTLGSLGSNQDISIETHVQSTTRAYGKLSGDALRGDSQRFLAVLATIRQEVSQPAKEFLEAREHLEEASEQLREAIHSSRNSS